MEPTHISKDDLDSLEFMIDQFERAQYALQAFQQHITQKYLKQGDAVKADGEIVRAEQSPKVININNAMIDYEAATG